MDEQEHNHEHLHEDGREHEPGHEHDEHAGHQDEHPHAHGHSHGHSHSGTPGGVLKSALAIIVVFMLVEFFGGLLTHSLALVSDAAHMLTDAAALGMSIFAAHMSAKRGSRKKTFGYYRAEVLSALANGVTLWVVSGIILREAVERFISPENVNPGPMLVIAILGLISNIACARILHGHHEHNINVRGAFLHVLTDMLATLGVVVAALLIMFAGWRLADPVISVVIVLLTLWSSWRLVRDAVHILMEGAPEHIDRDKVLSELSGIEGVAGVHELHIWTLTDGVESLSAHLLINDYSKSTGILKEANRRLSCDFGIAHSTLQLETEKLENTSCEGGNCCTM
jgi:cobalt-zinc-cadmium efflux system protein